MPSSPTAVAPDFMATYSSLAILQQEAVASTVSMSVPCVLLTQTPSAL